MTGGEPRVKSSKLCGFLFLGKLTFHSKVTQLITEQKKQTKSGIGQKPLTS